MHCTTELLPRAGPPTLKLGYDGTFDKQSRGGPGRGPIPRNVFQEKALVSNSFAGVSLFN